MSGLICFIGFGFETALSLRGSGILFITVITVGLATAFPHIVRRVSGSEIVGMGLMQVFFAAIGASANITLVMKSGSVLFLFAGLVLSVHLVFILVGGKLCRLNLEEIVIASNANMGGPTTAAAMAMAKRWEVSLFLPFFAVPWGIPWRR